MLSDLERLRKAEAVLKDEADVHAVQLEALLAMKHALATEVRWDLQHQIGTLAFYGI